MQPRNSSSFEFRSEEAAEMPQKSTAVLQFFFTKPPSPCTHTYVYICIYIYITDDCGFNIPSCIYHDISAINNHSFKIFHWIVVRWFDVFFRRRGTWPRRAPATRPTAPRWCHRDPSRVSRMSPPRRRHGGWDLWRTKARTKTIKKCHYYPMNMP